MARLARTRAETYLHHVHWTTADLPLILESLQGSLPGLAAQALMFPRFHSSRSATRGRGAKPKVRPGDDSRRESAVLILLVPAEDGSLVLPLIERADDGGPHARQIAFPGGRREDRDAGLIDTALREAEEEIGLPTSRVQVFGELTPLWIPVSGHVVHPVVGAWTDTLPALEAVLRPQPQEVARIILAPLGELLLERTLQTVDARGEDLEAPCFVWHDVIVWGATGAILSELRELALAASPAVPDHA